jgi:hypothetical protein
VGLSDRPQRLAVTMPLSPGAGLLQVRRGRVPHALRQAETAEFVQEIAAETILADAGAEAPIRRRPG